MGHESVIRHRLGRPHDARAIGTLARRVTGRWILAEQPASAAGPLLHGMSAKVIRRQLLDGQRFHLAWCDDGRLAGVAAMRDDSHLFQFFVSTRLHGHGIARQLWQRTMRDAIRRAGTRRFTLKAPPWRCRCTCTSALCAVARCWSATPAWSPSRCTWIWPEPIIVAPSRSVGHFVRPASALWRLQ